MTTAYVTQHGPSTPFMISPAIASALSLLRRAREYAEDLGRDVWDFAVEIQTLRAAGISNSDLRWLLGKGYVEHATEVTRPDDAGRKFRRDTGCRFSRKTCLVLTASGDQVACSTTQDWDRPKATGDRADAAGPTGSAGASRGLTPSWDRDRRELRLGGALIKRFKTTAPNQEAIIAAFEEEGWPPRIDDPIPPQFGQDPKCRLHDTINALNRNQKNRLINFLGDGSGQGVRWELTHLPDVTARNGAGAAGGPVLGDVRSAHQAYTGSTPNLH